MKKLDDDGNIKGCIEFVSLQDLKGSVYFGGRYDKLSEISKDKGLCWDIMIVDEAHEGVDTDKIDWAFAEIYRKYTLHLSGTPFKALANEKFEREAIYNWTYADEQKNKRDWDSSKESENPYVNLPKLSLYTYQMSEIVKDKIVQHHFDPARTLKIFEQFANDLIPENFGDNADFENRKNNVKELLNFFPVYGEDDGGKMTELDAEAVLTIPRRIYAREVVERGFMSNFLFANIGGIFNAPREIIELINNMQAIEEPKNLSPANIDENTATELNLNGKGEVEIPQNIIIGDASEIFGDKIYKETEKQLSKIVESAKISDKKDELKKLQDAFSKPVTKTLLDTAKKQYGNDLKKSTQNNLERQIKNTMAAVVSQEYGKFAVKNNWLEKERNDKIREAQDAGKSLKDIEKIDKEYNEIRIKAHRDMMENIKETLSGEEVWNKTTQKIVETVETERATAQKNEIEGNVRDHLRGFSRTIPAFLMAYGDENTTLQNFDKITTPEVFFEVTKNPQNGQGVTVEKFRELRDKYKLFDETVFNDAVRDFNERRKKLANYFEAIESGEDIFDYIPPQRTNQIFTPKKVVKDMVNKLEAENPGCFDNPKAKFADLYIKSGMYITEIVKRLYQSEKMKELYPSDEERLNHIFAEQVYGAAPTEIIYRISVRYILDFSEKIKIKKHNIKFCDTLKFAKAGNMESEVKKLFGV